MYQIAFVVSACAANTLAGFVVGSVLLQIQLARSKQMMEGQA